MCIAKRRKTNHLQTKSTFTPPSSTFPTTISSNGQSISHDNQKLEDFEKFEIDLARDFLEKAGYAREINIVPNTKPGTFVSFLETNENHVNMKIDTMFFEFQDEYYFANGEFMIKIGNITNSRDNIPKVDRILLLLVRISSYSN